MKNGFHHELITANNLAIAIAVQNCIFPHDPASVNYKESIEGITDNVYWLIYDCDVCVGVSGMYYHDFDPKSAWLGWFGILPQFRQKGYGGKALELFFDEARQRNFDFARLYTDEVDNADAIVFYRKKGMTCEPYLNADDITWYIGQTLIFSKSLSQKELTLWDNKYLGFAEQLAKQKLE